MASACRAHPDCEAYFADYLKLRSWPDAAQAFGMPVENMRWQGMIDLFSISHMRIEKELEVLRWKKLIEKPGL